MNSRQISLMFDHSKQQYNPVQTFGPQQSLYPTSLTSHKNIKLKKDLKPSRQLKQQEEQNYREETRIRLLTSFQESYLQSISQPTFTDPDLRHDNKSNTLSYSQSKKPTNSVDKYLSVDANQTFQNFNNSYKQAFYEAKKQRQINEMNNYENKGNTRNQGISNEEKKKYIGKDKIRALSQSIQQQLYHVSIQQRVYDYLISRIDDRGRLRKKKDNHQIVQNAIDFMDSGDQFMRELLKLKRMSTSFTTKSDLL